MKELNNTETSMVNGGYKPGAISGTTLIGAGAGFLLSVPMLSDSKDSTPASNALATCALIFTGGAVGFTVGVFSAMTS